MFTSKDREELRKEFRKLCLQHHPDKGGDHYKFIEIQNAYETALKNINAPAWDCSGTNDWQAFKDFENVVEKLKAYSFNLDLVGNWLWLAIDWTSPKHKELIECLKADKWRFSRSKKKWYWFNGVEDFKAKRKSKKSYDEVKATWGVFGSVQNEEEKIEQLTAV